jgi:hypothetical protein
MPQKWKMKLTQSWKYYWMMPVRLEESQLKVLLRRSELAYSVVLSWPVAWSFGAGNK